MKWEEKASRLQEEGYFLIIEALAPESDDKWMASSIGEGCRYGNTISDVVSQIYELVFN